MTHSSFTAGIQKVLQLSAVCIALGISTVAHAQIAATSPDTRKLTQLYIEYSMALRQTQSRITTLPLEERIALERRSIRTQLEKEFTMLFGPRESEETDPRKAIDRQRDTVSSIRDRLKELKVDLSLLSEQDKSLKKTLLDSERVDMPESARAYAEHLSKKAVLEERLEALEGLLPPQEDRLSKLQSEQWQRNFSLLFSFILYLFTFILVFSGEHLIRIRILSHIPHRGIRYATVKIFTMFVYLLFFFWILQGIAIEHPNVIAAFALVGAAIFISLQDVIKGIVGWLTQQRTVALGQRITVWTPSSGMLTGEVVDIGILHTTLLLIRTAEIGNLAAVGKTVQIPNAYLLTQPIVNYNSTSDFVRVECSVRIGFDGDWRRVREILEEIVDEETNSYGEEASRQAERRTRSYYFPQELRASSITMEIGAKGIVFTLSFLSPMRKRRETLTIITQRVLERFEEENITMISVE